MASAFKKWSDVTNLNFKEITTGTPDIWVRFVRGYHQDPYPFDGRGGTLAHAFYPMNNVGKECLTVFCGTIESCCQMKRKR